MAEMGLLLSYPCKNTMKPSLTSLLKYAGGALWLLFALLGLLLLPGFLRAINRLDMAPACYFGEAACQESRVCSSLPLPPQAEADAQEQSFPMAVDYFKLVGRSGAVVFRSTPEWQEAFRCCCARPLAQPYDRAEGIAENLVQEAKDAALRDFVASRRWLPFHQACLYRCGKRDIKAVALRDESGEYLLIHCFDY